MASHPLSSFTFHTFPSAVHFNLGLSHSLTNYIVSLRTDVPRKSYPPVPARRIRSADALPHAFFPLIVLGAMSYELC